MPLCRHIGTPNILQSDRGKEFKGAVKRFCEQLNIKKICSRAYHPQSQGKSERSHGTWKAKLRYDLLTQTSGRSFIINFYLSTNSRCTFLFFFFIILSTFVTSKMFRKCFCLHQLYINSSLCEQKAEIQCSKDKQSILK